MNEDINYDDIKLQHPFSMVLSGVSGSGKTCWVKRLIENIDEMVIPNIDRIVLSYTEKQNIYEELLNLDDRVILHEGLSFDLANDKKTLLIIDDQMTSGVNDSIIQELFIKGRHHRNLSIIFITQNLFPQGKFGRDIRLNANYLVIFKSPMFLSQIQYLDRQLYAHAKNCLTDSYINATANPYTYLFVVLRPECKDQLRLRSLIFPNESTIVYVPIHKTKL